MGSDDAQFDDESVADDEVLYRHIRSNFWVLDLESGARRLSSAFMRFERGMDGLSAYSAKLLSEKEVPPEAVMPDLSYGLMSVNVGDLRRLGCGVIFDPDNERPINFAHMLITQPRGDLSLSAARRLSNALIRLITLLRTPKVDS